MVKNFLKGAPRCDGKTNGSGLIDSGTFLTYLDHFIKHTQYSVK